MHDASAFFEGQFRRQVERGEYALNPFEKLALEHVRGSVLDFGCGLGNLTLEVARRGSSVLALDASRSAITRIRREAGGTPRLPIEALELDLAAYRFERSFDTIVAIGVLMFFRREIALRMLDDIQSHVAPGGCAVVNVLIEGTTYTELFGDGAYHLFERDELARHFADWELVVSRFDSFEAPGGTRKEFATVVARKPGVRSGGTGS